jgi:hypothetical protein
LGAGQDGGFLGISFREQAAGEIIANVFMAATDSNA